MMNFSIKLADTVFDIECNFESTKRYCTDYLCQQNSDYKIKISEEDICFEKQMDSLNSPEPYLETLAVYRKIAEKIIDRNTIVFHSSVIRMDEWAFVFTAPSGTGKSTHTRLWREHFKNRDIQMVNDDKPLIKVDGEVIVYGTPWMGKERLGNNIKVPIKAICFLKQGPQNKIVRLGKAEALPKMMRQTYRVNGKEKLARMIGLLNRIIDKIDIYEMECDISYDAVELAYQNMSRETKE